MSRRLPGFGWVLAALLLAIPALPAHAADTVTYYLTDSLHSVVVELDAQRQVLSRTHYGPYGRVLNRTLRDGPGYSGHEEDPATGLNYMQQRYYDPEARRFLSTDPVQATAGGFNRYAYANDNPYRYTDPDGRCTGSHISNKGGTCVSTGGFTTGTNGAMQGMAIARARSSRPSASGGQTAGSAAQSQSSASQCSAECNRAHVQQAYRVVHKYDIKGSGYALHYDPSLPYDGLTYPFGDIILGPSAYSSESWLASNLGHEIEVHWDRQMQILGPYKSWAGFYFREIEAYKYNILNFKRFGNTPQEQTEIYNRLRENERRYDYFKDHDGF